MNEPCTEARLNSVPGSGGFTILELMIAMSVFATVLLVCTVGILQIGRSYSKGITSSRTQEAARAVLDEISEAIQFGAGLPADLANNGAADGVCAGGKRFSYVLNRQLTDSVIVPASQSRHVVVVDPIGSAACTSGLQAVNVTNATLTNPGGGPFADAPRELLSTRMRLTDLTVLQVPVGGDPDSTLYEVTVRVVSGDDQVLTGSPLRCREDRAGTQFCAISELKTVVQKRVR